MLNPASRFYAEFKAHMTTTYEDTYFGHDALVMEVNSRGMGERVAALNRNAEALADMLYPESAAAGQTMLLYSKFTIQFVLITLKLTQGIFSVLFECLSMLCSGFFDRRLVLYCGGGCP